MGTPFDPTNPLHNIITDEAGNPVPQKYDPEANSGQGGMVVVSTEDVQKVQQTGSIVLGKELGNPVEIFSGTIKNGETLQSEIYDVGKRNINIYYQSNGNNKNYILQVHYLNLVGDTIETETIFEELPEGMKGIINFIPKYPRLKFVLQNNTLSNRTIRFEYSQSNLQEVSIRKSPQRKITVCPSITVTGQEKKILIDDYTFEKGTIAWGLYFIESSRTLSNILNYMYIRVEMTSGWDYSITPHGRCNFRQDIALSTQDEFDKGLAVDMVDVLGVDDTSLRKNIILAGKYFNVPLGERIRISIINTAPEGEFTFYINQASFVEEGIF